MWFVCHARWRRKLSSKKSAVNCHRKRTKTQPTVHICKLNSELAIIKFFYSNLSKLYRFFGCGPKLRNACMCECGMRMWKFSNMSSLPVGVCVCGVYEIRKAAARATATTTHAYAAAQCCHVDQSTARPTVTCVSIALVHTRTQADTPHMHIKTHTHAAEPCCRFLIFVSFCNLSAREEEVEQKKEL